MNFKETFRLVTDNDPFPWQQALYERFIADRRDNIPPSCNLPTGLGKTSVVAIWLIALAKRRDKMPRRLVYVVNRRTVVDQTTSEVEKLRENLPRLNTWFPELAISTLRGQFADNRKWLADPSRPAVIVGTVDMIGSRLLFSGYGCGFKSKPLHAGFLGQDALLVHDEAHLEPAFQDLIVAIQSEQKRCNEFTKFHVMEMTATSRGGGTTFPNEDEQKENGAHPIVQKRVGAKKTIELHPADDPKNPSDQLAKLALKHNDSGKAVLVFVRKVDDVEKIIKKLPKDTYEQLTGTLRGLERDGLVKKPIFQRFLPESNRDKNVTPAEGTVYLVCTSAGEVGVNISADHLVCDLSTFDSMAQRFGRVNRFGERDDTRIDVVYPKEFDEKDDYDARLKETLKLFRLANGDGSPAVLSTLHRKAMEEGSGAGSMSTDRAEALRKYILATYAPQPTILPTTDILFDAWALTTINKPVVKDKLPGRPPVEPYLHGISDYDPPQTTIAWRREVELLTQEILDQNKLEPEDILDLYPLKPHEELSGPTYGKNKVFEQLEEIAARDAKREPDKRLSAWVIDPDGSVVVYPLAKLVEKDKQNKPLVPLGSRTVLLPPQAGGFSGGLLKGDEPFAEAIEYDVSDHWYADKEKTIRRRWRGKSDDAEYKKVTKQMRLIRPIYIPAPGGDEDAEGWEWRWFTRPNSADDDGSKTAQEPVTWDDHTRQVTENATRIASALRLPDELQQALVLAAKFHDLGKKRAVWQRSIGHQLPTNPKPEDWLAKSGGKMKLREITDYRHEFGSLLDLQRVTEFNNLKDKPELQDLILHLIAVHHGYGRPHFPEDRAFDPERSQSDADKIGAEVPRRFARLQRKYGRWGLAYLESLLRAADWAASANPSEFVEDKK